MNFENVDSSVLIEKVLEIVGNKLPKSQVALASQFIRELYAPLSLRDLSMRDDSDLYGAGLSLFNALKPLKTNERHIRVYNPCISKHGWQSTHTVVEIIVPDTPFIVDSVKIVLARLELSTHLLLHFPLCLKRDEKGLAISFEKNKQCQQTVLLIEIDRFSDQALMSQLKAELLEVLDEVTLVVKDWKPLCNKIQEVADELKNTACLARHKELDDTVAFLRWLASHNFTLMGYQKVKLEGIKGDHKLVSDRKQALGLLTNSAPTEFRLALYPKAVRDMYFGHNLLIITKGETKSRVHRQAYIDHISIKVFNEQGQVIGAHQFTGLYASSIYNRSASDIPLISGKLKRVIASAGYQPGTHSYRVLLNVLENYPRDELIQANEYELKATACAILNIQDRELLRLFVRSDPFGHYISCLIYVPKERYNTEIRVKCQHLLQQHFDSSHPVEYLTNFSDDHHARTQYLIRSDKHITKDCYLDLEQNLTEAVRSWQDKLADSLNAHFGEEQANHLYRKYDPAFSAAYMADVLPGTAVADLEILESLTDEAPLDMLLFRPQEQADSSLVKLKLFNKNEAIHLSDVLPMLENMGLRVIGERPYHFPTKAGDQFWVLDFSMFSVELSVANVESYSESFSQALKDIWYKKLEDDGFNKLVLRAGLSGRQVSVLRAYARYMRQIGSSFSQQYIEQTLENYPQIATKLWRLFEARFALSQNKSTKKLYNELVDELKNQLDEVSNLDDDRIIRRYIELIKASLRTNYYQLDELGNDKDYLSIKFSPGAISNMPKPCPVYEIFVYSPRFEGVHLRGGKVARGGLRWSDRQEDFRTEILGLVKAQQVKNTVIVPVGAKGGFVCKHLPEPSERELFLAEGQACYRLFIRGLLDITDNNLAGKITQPKQVICHDEPDPYLVVAADKGTATFSDIANEISEHYQFWLGDAFASGGSVGYDHKKMGITARGAWESVKRHFRELGINCQTTHFSCIGIGDMAGDVFGNGMLLSTHIKLLAAFNHQHIFIDPQPDVKSAYAERNRLFNLPRSSWSDYDSRLLSEGGGIFDRKAKSIKLSPQVKQLIASNKTTMTPNELIKALLCAQVDLLWNGGIGTYVKGRLESDLDVGDRANDSLRVNGGELKAKIVGEGGNLGFTQAGRIEFAETGGRINTDFIDNVGGVDCSDNEVNIKILLNGLVTAGELTTKQRNNLLTDMTKEVSEIVLSNAYKQTQSLSVTEANSAKMLKELRRFIHHLELDGKLDRALEGLPSDEVLNERIADSKGLTRPELSVLLAYGKMVLKEQLNIDAVTQDPCLAQSLLTAFPKPLQEKYSVHMQHHPLRGEIIATRLANQLVNIMGVNFVHRLMDETGAEVADVVASFDIAKNIFFIDDYLMDLEALDNHLDSSLQLELMYQCRRQVKLATRWLLHHRDRNASIAENIEFFQTAYSALKDELDVILVEQEKQNYDAVITQMLDKGIPAKLAEETEQRRILFSVLNIAQIAKEHQLPVLEVAQLYYQLGAELELHWFMNQIGNQPVDNHWQALARSAYREELDWQQRRLTSVILKWGKNEVENINGSQMILSEWLALNDSTLKRWRSLLADFRANSSHDFAKFSVALRELNLLKLACVDK